MYMYVGAQWHASPSPIPFHPEETNPFPNTHDATRRREQGGGGGGGGEGEEGEGGPDQNDYYVGGNSARGGGRCVCDFEEEGGLVWMGAIHWGFVCDVDVRSCIFIAPSSHVYTRDTCSGLSVVGPPQGGGGGGGDDNLVAGIFQRAR